MNRKSCEFLCARSVLLVSLVCSNAQAQVPARPNPKDGVIESNRQELDNLPASSSSDVCRKWDQRVSIAKTKAFFYLTHRVIEAVSFMAQNDFQAKFRFEVSEATSVDIGTAFDSYRFGKS